MIVTVFDSSGTTRLVRKTIGELLATSADMPEVSLLRFAKGKWYKLGNTNSAETAVTTELRYYPVQRKSDGVCGIVFVATRPIFYPMSGDHIKDEAAGFVVKENWNPYDYLL